VDVLVVSQQRRSPLGVSQSIPERLARRGLVIPLVVERLDCEYHIIGKGKGEKFAIESSCDREFE